MIIPQEVHLEFIVTLLGFELRMGDGSNALLFVGNAEIDCQQKR